MTTYKALLAQKIIRITLVAFCDQSVTLKSAVSTFKLS